MPLGPLRAACVQPAPKSRLVVFGPLMSKSKINSNSRNMTKDIRLTGRL
jgi:hypothetical protein